MPKPSPKSRCSSRDRAQAHPSPRHTHRRQSRPRCLQHHPLTTTWVYGTYRARLGRGPAHPRANSCRTPPTQHPTIEPRVRPPRDQRRPHPTAGPHRLNRASTGTAGAAPNTTAPPPAGSPAAPPLAAPGVAAPAITHPGALLAAPPAPARHLPSVPPAAAIVTAAADGPQECTLGYPFTNRGTGTTYGITAGHCNSHRSSYV